MSISLFKIEKGIEMPKPVFTSRLDALPLKEMEEGDSVLIEECNKSVSNNRIKTVYQAVRKNTKNFPTRKYKIAMIDSPTKKDIMEIRIWRTL